MDVKTSATVDPSSHVFVLGEMPSSRPSPDSTAFVGYEDATGRSASCGCALSSTYGGRKGRRMDDA